MTSDLDMERFKALKEGSNLKNELISVLKLTRKRDGVCVLRALQLQNVKNT